METVNLKTIHQDLKAMKRDIELIKHILEEEYELSDEAKNELAKARATPGEKYIKHEKIAKEFL